ncbi:ATP-binding protein [Larkinella soli]|uniref:ATP-binding protein n=1 Tax=Larkinella soli TaxID=1770527 RepID=UPI000FFB10EB|nr:ATP-binding protein [Larkinella soli]
MKKLVTCCLSFFLLTPAFGQSNPKIDSLDRLIRKAATDTARINLVIEKIYLLNQSNLDSAIALARKTVADARRIGYRKGEAYALIKLAAGNYFKGDYGHSAAYLKNAAQIFTSLKDPKGLGNTFLSYGNMYGMQGKTDSAIASFQKAIQYAGQINDRRMLNASYQNIAISYQMNSDFPHAILYNQKALKHFEETGDVGSQSYIQLNLGLIYSAMGDVKRAEQSLFRAIRLSRAASAPIVELYTYSNLSTLYEKDKRFGPSYDYAMKAAGLARKIGDPGIEAASLSKAAISSAFLNDLDRAESMARRAVPIATASRQPYNLYQAYSALGLALKMKNRFGEAIENYEKGFGAIRGSDYYEESVGEAYRHVSECYSRVGDYRKALASFRTSAAISDSVRSRDNIQKSTELTMNYEFEKKQQTLNARQERRRAEARARQLALSVGLGLSVVIAGLAFYAYFSKRKANALLHAQKTEIEKTLTELRTTQEQLIHKEKMASLGELTAGIAHEIQNPLNFVNNFSDVSEELVQELKEEAVAGRTEDVLAIADDLARNLQKIHSHGRRADSIVKGMLEHSRSSAGRRQATDLNALADEYLRLAYHGLRAKEKDFSAVLVTDFDPKLGAVEVVPQDLGRVLLNLYTNAFYAVKEKQKKAQDGYQPTVSVLTHRQNGTVEIRVRDNGTGMPEPVKQKIFQPFFTTKPTGQGTGLGLSLSYDIITKGHGGEILAETQPGQFTEMTIRLPVHG